VIDGPPGLSPMSESILRAGGRVIVPLRPALPDLWALPWFAAVMGKARRAGPVAAPLVVCNQYRGEELAALVQQCAEWNLPLHPEPIPDDQAFPRLYLGEPLPEPLRTRLLHLADGVPEQGLHRD